MLFYLMLVVYQRAKVQRIFGISKFFESIMLIFIEKARARLHISKKSSTFAPLFVCMGQKCENV